MLNAKNNAETILSASINSSVTSLTVADASVLPVVPFVITIDNEIMTVTNVVGNVLTVTRGAESTVPTSHLAGVPVENRWTAGMYDDLVDRGSSNPFPSMPYIGSAPIIESGSNANGRYIKYEDGTMICTKILSLSATSTNHYYSLNETLAATFIYDEANSNIPIVSIAAYNSQYATNSVNGMAQASGYAISSTALRWGLVFPANITSGVIKVSIIAIGRWK